MRKPSPLTVNLLIALLCLVWGSTWIVIREGLKDLPPFTAAGIRFTVAGLLMAVVAMTVGKREGGTAPRAPLWISLGVLNFAASYGIVYWVETRLPSGLVAVLWGVFPMLMAACGHFYIPGERLRGVQWLGFVGGFLGVALLFSTDLQQFGGQGIPAAAILLASPLVCAVSTAYVKRHGGNSNSTLLNRNGMLLGAALLLLLALATEREARIVWTPNAVLSILYLSIAGTVVTFGIYFWLLRYADAHRLGLIAYITPMIALYLGSAVGEEPITPYTYVGTALILSGVVAVVRGKRVPEAPKPPQHSARVRKQAS